MASDPLACGLCRSVYHVAGCLDSDASYAELRAWLDRELRAQVNARMAHFIDTGHLPTDDGLPPVTPPGEAVAWFPDPVVEDAELPAGGVRVTWPDGRVEVRGACDT